MRFLNSVPEFQGQFLNRTTLVEPLIGALPFRTMPSFRREPWHETSFVTPQRVVLSVRVQ